MIKEKGKVKKKNFKSFPPKISESSVLYAECTRHSKGLKWLLKGIVHYSRIHKYNKNTFFFLNFHLDIFALFILYHCNRFYRFKLYNPLVT